MYEGVGNITGWQVVLRNDSRCVLLAWLIKQNQNSEPD